MQHAWLARSLIRACGGLEPAAAACRLERSRLSQCQTPGSGAFLTVDVLVDLETFCGEPLYSRAIVEAHPAAVRRRDLLEEACETSELAAQVQRRVRLAGGAPLDRRSRDELLGDLDQLDARRRALVDALTGGAAA
jgi:hypothetical protein